MQSDFYKSHLERVSRSFAFCIAQLEGDLKNWVSLSYLLCRLLDTVEDAPWQDPEDQTEAYRYFQEFLKSSPETSVLEKWVHSFPAQLPQGERILLNESEGVFLRFHALPEPIRVVMQSSILNMYRGMRFFSARSKLQGEMRLRNLADVNQYCFFVAGVVGDLLAHLLEGTSQVLTAPPQLLDAHHFGLFLQKVNLLKDQSKDEAEGRHLVAPSREDLFASMSVNAEGALRYLLSVPVRERGYRVFCAWSLFLGLSSLRWMERSTFFGSVLLNKPPRIATKWVLKQVEDRIDSNEELRALFQKSLPDFPKVKYAGSSKTGFADSSLQVYEGSLGLSQFEALGLV